MSSFRIVPQVSSFSTWAECCKAFGIGEKDLLLTDGFLYHQFLENTPFAGVIIQDSFGPGEPSEEKITAIRKKAEEIDFRRVVAVGGGSVMDIAKLLAVSGWEDCLALFQKREVPRKDKPLLLIPTTCGTGSEITNISVAAFPALHTKIGLADDALYADHAVLVSELIAGLPMKVFMHSSIDALIHAMESYLSPKANAFTEIFSLKAIRTFLDGYRLLSENGPEARKELAEDFLTAASMAGIAFSNAGCGLIHAMSYPIGGTYHLPHGEANYEVMSAVLRYYRDNAADQTKLNILEEITGGFDALEQLVNGLCPRKPMGEFGMTSREASAFAADVIKNQQRLLTNCHIPTDEAAIEAIYNKII